MLKTGGEDPRSVIPGMGGAGMQINLNESPGAVQAKLAAALPATATGTAGLESGDVIMAAVERVEGDALLLRVSGGALLRAALQGECCFGIGDAIEAAVSRNGGSFVLTVLNVTSAGTQASAESASRTIQPQTVPEMLGLLSRNPGMDAAAARFLANHGIPYTAENLSALAQLARGGSIGAVLGLILDVVSQPDSTLLPQGDKPAETLQQQYREPQLLAADAETPQNAVQPEAGLPQGTVAAAKPAVSGAGLPEQTGSMQPGDLANSAAEHKTPEPMQDTAASAAAAKASQAAAPYKAEETGGQTSAQPATAQVFALIGDELVRIQPSGTHAISQPGTEDNPAPAAEKDTAILSETKAPVKEPGSQPVPAERMPQEKPEARIREAIRELLIRPGEETDERMKKTAAELPQALKTLKSLLVQSDINNKEIYARSTEQAIRQMEMADRAAKFEYMQLPVAVRDGEYQTAELYVFRQPEKRKAEGDAGHSILVALDTQHIGRVEALIKESSGDISLEFRLERPEIAEGLKQNAGAIAQAAEAGGYRLTGMRFAGLEKRTTVLNAAEAVPDAGRTEHGIDVTI